jgi:cytoskeletal protein CcmA (bactofilin family)
VVRNDVRKRESIQETTVTSVIGADCTIRGEVRCSGTIRVDGAVEGTVEAEDTIMIGQNAKVNAALHAKQIVIGGEVHGNVAAEETLEIQSTGSLYGDIQASKLTMALGVIFQGSCVTGGSQQEGQPTDTLGTEEVPAEGTTTYSDEF